MANLRKKKVLVIYGGRSGEHEISLRSAASVMRHLDRSRYEVIPVAIDKTGKWHLNDLSLIENSKEVLPVLRDAPEVALSAYPNEKQDGGSLVAKNANSSALEFIVSNVDVIFPVMHGPLCEDGSIQGLFELAGVAYVGAGVLSSAVSMDKDFSKKLVQAAGIAVTPSLTIKKPRWEAERRDVLNQIAKQLGANVFVKPANLGSSVGVEKTKNPESLAKALDQAFTFDTKALVERALDVREIEFAVLENPKYGAPGLVSAPGEIIPTHEFYSYEAKYLDEKGAHLVVPAPLSPVEIESGQEIARKVFDLLECEGMARVDLFMDRSTGDFVFNELNTIPGFTSISMYPKLWEYSGISYNELLSRLIELAEARQKRRNSLIRDYEKDSKNKK